MNVGRYSSLIGNWYVILVYAFLGVVGKLDTPDGCYFEIWLEYLFNILITIK